MKWKARHKQKDEVAVLYDGENYEEVLEAFEAKANTLTALGISSNDIEAAQRECDFRYGAGLRLLVEDNVGEILFKPNTVIVRYDDWIWVYESEQEFAEDFDYEPIV